MKATLRMAEALRRRVIDDLRRPHSFAFERVGFLSTSTVTTGPKETLVLITGYHAVADEHYLEDRAVGAKIGPDAIREAMGRALADDVGQLHVHLHDHRGPSRPSRTDLLGLPPLAQSLGRAAPRQTSGFLILSEDAAWVELHLPGIPRPVRDARINAVGFPFLALL